MFQVVDEIPFSPIGRPRLLELTVRFAFTAVAHEILVMLERKFGAGYAFLRRGYAGAQGRADNSVFELFKLGRAFLSVPGADGGFYRVDRRLRDLAQYVVLLVIRHTPDASGNV